MNKTFKVKFNMKGVLYGTIVLLMIIGGFLFIPKVFMDQSQPVEFTMIERNAIPEKILSMIDKYVDQERALAVKLDNKIYVVVTRGSESKYGIEIEKISMAEDEGKKVMKVEAVYKNKEKAHPYIVVETDLKELPDKIELGTTIQDK